MPDLGHYNQNEYASRVDHFLCADPKNEHLHNNFVCALIGNLTRDLPDHGVANWVSANDKPSTVTKPVSGDAAEQRLKTEVMQLPPRDRRRIKGIPEVCSRNDADHLCLKDPTTNIQQRDPNETLPTELEECHLAKQIKLPSQVPASAGGLNKTSKTISKASESRFPLRSRGPYEELVPNHFLHYRLGTGNPQALCPTPRRRDRRIP